jgi:hypothetical protein
LRRTRPSAGFFRAGGEGPERRVGRPGRAANENTFEGERLRGDRIAWRDLSREYVV